MYSEVSWVLVSSGTQVKPQIIYSNQNTFQAIFPFLMTKGIISTGVVVQDKYNKREGS